MMEMPAGGVGPNSVAEALTAPPMTGDDVWMSMRDICDLLGVTPPTIRLSERYGLDFRYEVAENGYRSFPYESYAQLFGMRSLAKAGMPLKEAISLCNEGSIDDYRAALERCEREAERRRAYEEHVIWALEDVRALATQACDPEQNYQIVTSRACWLLDCHAPKLNGQDPQVVRAWAEAMPVTYLAPTYDPASGVAEIGLAVDERDACVVGAGKDGPAEYLPACRCLATFYAVGDMRSIRKDADGLNGYAVVCEPGLRFVREQGYELTGKVRCRLVATNMRDAAGVPRDWYYNLFPIG